MTWGGSATTQGPIGGRSGREGMIGSGKPTIPRKAEECTPRHNADSYGGATQSGNTGGGRKVVKSVNTGFSKRGDRRGVPPTGEATSHAKQGRKGEGNTSLDRAEWIKKV